jgi:hypothetical protein
MNITAYPIYKVDARQVEGSGLDKPQDPHANMRVHLVQGSLRDGRTHEVFIVWNEYLQIIEPQQIDDCDRLIRWARALLLTNQPTKE